VQGNTAIDLIYNEASLFICDRNLPGNQKRINYQIKPNRIFLGVKTVRVAYLEEKVFCQERGCWSQGPFVWFHGKRLVLIDQDWKKYPVDQPFEADLVIISGSPRSEIEDLCAQVRMKNIIIDGSVPSYKLEQLKQSCSRLGIPCHSVRDDGAFVMKW